IKTTAERRGEDLVINGGKMWITNGCQADWMCLLANTRRDGPRHRTKSLICLPLKTPEFGGLGLDYSYTVALFEELAAVNASGVVTGILVQTDICTPALARYGSDELRKQFLTPSIAGDLIGCVGISEPHCGSDVA
ncbi:putative electron transport oxidoreductase, partial [Ixodes scapularis]